MTRPLLAGLFVACAASLAVSAPANAADTAFTYKTSYRNVAKDPDGVWTSDVLSPGPAGVTIHEYALKTPQGGWLVSQIWNADCDATSCPTRLVRVTPDGRKTVIVDDTMHQVIPPDDPRFAAVAKSAAAFAATPFQLSPDGKILVNGDFKFEIGGGKP